MEIPTQPINLAEVEKDISIEIQELGDSGIRSPFCSIFVKMADNCGLSLISIEFIERNSRKGSKRLETNFDDSKGRPNHYSVDSRRLNNSIEERTHNCQLVIFGVLSQSV
jgi:hypothetical protein